ncbi:hypothetical protein ACFFX0_01540 [Citricoccus parietis]|uniref:Uncharacterized protein n=1 Tax=Citricoccus parietis TaxID=592307 RepID=A0ABV5FTE8_9MICC
MDPHFGGLNAQEIMSAPYYEVQFAPPWRPAAGYARLSSDHRLRVSWIGHRTGPIPVRRLQRGDRRVMS